MNVPKICKLSAKFNYKCSNLGTVPKYIFHNVHAMKKRHKFVLLFVLSLLFFSVLRDITLFTQILFLFIL